MTGERIKIIDRIRKLREVRVDRGATPHEADTAQRLADKLEKKYSIRPNERIPFGDRTIPSGAWRNFDDLFREILRNIRT